MIYAYNYDIGCKRTNNEDYYFVPDKDSNLQDLMIVADGMGGHNAGEVASKTAVDTASNYLTEYYDNINLNFIRSAIRIANKKIYELSRKNPLYKGMGTTMTLAYLQENSVLIGHVGDCRAYVISKDGIKQITKDHSYVQMLIDQGDITLEEAYEHPYKNVITRSVGTSNSLKIDTFEYPLEPNDIVVLCSDGLINHVSDEEIYNEIKTNLQLGTDNIVKLAKQRGGSDNITVIAAVYKNTILDNRYKLIRQIGTGGMSNVFCAKDLLDNEKLVTVKILKQEHLKSEKMVEMFKEEGKVTLKLNHKNTVKGKEFHCEDNLMYIVLNYVEGINIKNYIENNGAFEENLAINIALQIARALRYTHNSGLIHKDVKPQNIMLDNEFNTFLTDYGLAGKKDNKVDSQNVLGSVYYFSPEQAKGDNLSMRSDIYSLGVVLYEMVTGVLPFDGEDVHKVIMQHLHTAPVPPIDVNRSLSPSLNQVILKSMSKDSEYRYPNINTFIADLKKCISNKEGGFVTHKQVPLDGDSNSFAWKNLAVGAMVLLALFVGVYAISYINYNNTEQSPVADGGMPLLTDLSLSEAKAVLDELGVKYQIEYYQETTGESGKVVHQSIKEYTSYDSSDTVLLGVALNVREANMPDFYRMHKDDASYFLADVEIDQIEYVYVDSQVPYNFIVSQMPAANTDLNDVDSVVLYVSNNNVHAKVPNLQGLTVEEAKATAEESGFLLGIIYEDDEAKGVEGIIKQFPLEGQSHNNSLKIDIWIPENKNKPHSFETNLELTIKEDDTKVMVCYEDDLGDIYYINEYSLDMGISNLNINFNAQTAQSKNIHIFYNGIRHKIIEDVGALQ